MARTVKVFDAQVNVTFGSDSTQESIKEISKALDTLVKKVNSGQTSLNKMSNALKALENNEAYSTVEKLNVSLKNANQSAKISTTANGKLTFSLKNIKKSTEEASNTADNYAEKMANFQKRINEASRPDINSTDAIDSAVSDINRLESEFLNFNRSAGKVWEDFRDGIAIIRGGGSTITGLRNIFTNVGDLTSYTARAFDGMANASELLADRRLPRLQRSLKHTSQRATEASQASIELTNKFKEIAKQESFINKSVFNELANGAASSSKEFTRLQRVILTTGTASEAQLDRVRVELERSINSLNISRSEYEKLGVEGKAAFDKLRAAKETELRLLDKLEAQSRSVREENQKIAAVAKEQGISFEEAAQKTGRSWFSVFNIFKRGKGDVKDLNSEFRKTTKSVDKTTNSVSQLSLVMSGLTGGLIGGGLVTAIPLIFNRLSDKLTGAVSAASDAEESMSKFAVVFDSELDPAIGMSDSLVQSVIEEIDLMAETMGRSKFEMREFAAQFQDTFVPLGFGREEAAKLSISMTELTQDLSSFYNMTEREASDRLSSYLVGNYENARAFGVQVNATAIDAELLRMGIDGGTRAVDQQVKSMAALKLLYEGTTDAQGDVIRTSDSFANMMRTIQGNAQDAAVALGNRLLPVINPLLALFIRFQKEVGPTVSRVIENIYSKIEPLSNAMVSLFNNTSNFEDFSIILKDTLLSAIDYMSDFVRYAAGWAYKWGVEIYNGLIEVADDLIYDAITYIGDLISSFLEPGSPPKEGPLSDIDEWGGGLVKTFGEGFSSADYSFLSDTADKIADAFDLDTDVGKEGFEQAQSLLEQLTGEALNTGVVNEEVFGQLKEQLGEGNEALADFIKRSTEYQAAQNEVKKIEDDILKARIAGENTLGLENQLSIAKDKLELAKREATQAEDRLNYEKKLAGITDETENASVGGIENQAEKTLELEKETLDKKRNLGLVSEEDYQRQLARLYSKYSEQAFEDQEYDLAVSLNNQAKEIEKSLADQAQAEKDAKKSELGVKRELERKHRKERKLAEKKTAREIYEENIAILDRQLADGVISQEEYSKQRLKIEEKYYNDVLEEGGQVLQSNIDNIKKYQAEVDAIRASKRGGKNKGKLGLADLGLTVEDFLPSGDEIAQGVADSVGEIADTLQIKVEEKLQQFSAGSIGQKIRETFDSWFPTGTETSNELLGLFTTFKTFIDDVSSKINWDENKLLITRFFDDIYESIFNFKDGAVRIITKDIIPTISNLAENIYEFFLVSSDTGDGGKASENVLGTFIVDLINNFAENISQLGEAIKGFSEAFKEGDITGTILGFYETLSAALLASPVGVFAETLAETFLPESVLEGAEEFMNRFSAAFDMEGGGLEGLLKGIEQGLSTFLSPEEMEFVYEITDMIRTLSNELIPQLVTNVKELFNETGLGTDILTLGNTAFQEMTNIVKNLLPLLKPLAIIIGAVLFVAILAFIKIIQGIIDIMPYVELALQGIVRAITGIIEVFGGMFDTAIGIFKLLFTDDSEAAIQQVRDGYEKLASGIIDIISGLLVLVTAKFGALYGIDDVIKYKDDMLYYIDQLKVGFAELVGDIVESTLGFFTNLYDTLVGNSIIPDMVSDIISSITGLKDDFIALITALTTDGFALFEALKTNLVKFIGGFIDVGAGIANSIYEGLTGSFGKVTSYLADFVPGMSTPVAEGSEETEGIFRGLYNTIVGNSIVPDMVNGVIAQYEIMANYTKDMMSMMVTLFEEGYTLIVGYTSQANNNITSLTQIAMQELYKIYTKVFGAIVQLYELYIKSNNTSITTLTQFITRARKLADLPMIISFLVDRFSMLGVSIDSVNNKIAKQISLMTKLVDLNLKNSEIENSSNTANFPDGFHEKGAWNIPFDNYRAVLHKGEMVVPASVAESFRGMLANVSSLAGVSVGNSLATASVGATSEQAGVVFNAPLVNINGVSGSASEIGRQASTQVIRALKSRGMG